MATAPRKTVSATEFNNVKHRLAELGVKIEVLQRQSKGTTRANAEVARLKAQVEAITTQLRLAGERYNNAGDPAIKASAAGQVYALDDRVTELFNDVSERVSALEADMAEAKGKIAEYGSTLGAQGTEIVMLKEGQTSLHERVSSITTQTSKTPWWHFLVAIVVGVVASLIWHSIKFTQTVPQATTSTTILPNKQTVVVPLTAANSTLAAVCAGIAAAAIALAIMSFFKSGKKTTQTSKTTQRSTVGTTPSVAFASAPTVKRTSVKTAATSPNDGSDPTPTKVFTTEPGVQTGARS